MDSNIQQLNVRRTYFDQIKNGLKTTEGRIYDGKVLKFQQGDILIFSCTEDPSLTVSCCITRLEKYKDFYTMLQSCGYKNCIPDADDIYQALDIYHQFPSYYERSLRDGVMAISIKVIPNN